MKTLPQFLLNSPNTHCYFAAQTSVLFVWRDLWQLSIMSWIALNSLVQICCSNLLLVWQALSRPFLTSLMSSWLVTAIITVNFFNFQSAWCLIWIVYCCQNYTSFLEKSKSLWFLLQYVAISSIQILVLVLYNKHNTPNISDMLISMYFCKWIKQ